MTQRIEDVRGLLVVGETYLVPCVRNLWLLCPEEVIRPVIGPPHTDPTYFPDVAEHYHVDLRFMSDAEVRDYVKGSLHDCSRADRNLAKATALVLPTLWYTSPIRRPRVCHRQMPGYPLEFTDYDDRPGPNAVLPEIERDYAEATVDPACARCPHRGTPLNGLPQDWRGRVVCPAHGLRWDLWTGRQSPRTIGGGK